MLPAQGATPQPASEAGGVQTSLQQWAPEQRPVLSHPGLSRPEAAGRIEVGKAAGTKKDANNLTESKGEKGQELPARIKEGGEERITVLQPQAEDVASFLKSSGLPVDHTRVKFKLLSGAFKGHAPGALLGGEEFQASAPLPRGASPSGGRALLSLKVQDVWLLG